MLQYIFLFSPTFPCPPQKLPSTAGFCIFTNTYTSCLFFQISVIKSPLALVVTLHKFDFASCCQSPQDLFIILSDSSITAESPFCTTHQINLERKKIVHIKFVVYPFYYHRQTSSYCLCRCHRLCCIFHILSEAYLVRLCSLQIFPENNSLLLLLCSQIMFRWIVKSG
jgi:hypothetical protein